MKCKNCRFCVATGQDMGAPHMCYANPPVIHFVPVPHPMDPKQIGLQQITARPMVQPDDPACVEYDAEPGEDSDDEAPPPLYKPLNG